MGFFISKSNGYFTYIQSYLSLQTTQVHFLHTNIVIPSRVNYLITMRSCNESRVVTIYSNGQPFSSINLSKKA